MTSKHKSEDYLKIGVLNVQRCKQPEMFFHKQETNVFCLCNLYKVYNCK